MFWYEFDPLNTFSAKTGVRKKLSQLYLEGRGIIIWALRTGLVAVDLARNQIRIFFFFYKVFFVGHIHMDFWWRLLGVSKPEWVLPYSHCRGECNVHFLRSTSGATHCQPLDGQHCGALTMFISCPRIFLCGSSESQTRDQQIMSAAC